VLPAVEDDIIHSCVCSVADKYGGGVVVVGGGGVAL